jgi:hypothetical protein
MTLDSVYVKKIFDAWNYELKDDETIKKHTWLVGDYYVFVYNHSYIYGMLSTRHDEVLFVTTTQPKKGTDKVHCTVTAFHVDLMEPDYEFLKIDTYVFVNHYRPIVGETEAKNTMLCYLEQYLDEYRHDTYNCYLLSEMRETLEEDLHIYMENWKNHYVFYDPPHDFGGAIILNKLTSKLNFLGSSVWMGYGTRYFPLKGGGGQGGGEDQRHQQAIEIKD